MDDEDKKRIEEIRTAVMKPHPFGRMDRDDRTFIDQLRVDALWLINTIAILNVNPTQDEGHKQKKNRG
jgi:hypothetical protein